MYFFEKNESYSKNIMCIDESGDSYTYEEIWNIGGEMVGSIEPGKLVLLLCRNDVESVAIYLALLRRRCPVILMGAGSDKAQIENMIENYIPDVVVGLSQKMKESFEGTGFEFSEMPAGGGDYCICMPQKTGPDRKQYSAVTPELALLLSTSGSTGTRKLVRLSYDNIQSNCESIVEYLGITSAERAITTLPMEYTYGLSVLHSHVAAGASVVMTERTFFNREFWDMVSNHHVTSLAGVPYSYEMLNRLNIYSMDIPSLKTLTQAGGHLKVELHKKLAQWAGDTGRRFFVMYGQTEATARMSYIPPEKCLDKIGSIGIPVPGGSMEIVKADEGGRDGEIMYIGSNVSLGYAECREDLAKTDENGGRLLTGDIGYEDEEGYFYITGRKKRFLKLYGKRMSLDAIQEQLSEHFGTDGIACTGDDTRGAIVFIADSSLAEKEEEIIRLFMDKWGIRHDKVSVNFIDEIPRSSSGKIRYTELR